MLESLSFSVIDHGVNEDGLHFRVEVAPLGVQICIGSSELGSHRSATTYQGFGAEKDDVLKTAVSTVQAFVAARPEVRALYGVARDSFASRSLPG